jgi:hypothetical protein
MYMIYYLSLYNNSFLNCGDERQILICTSLQSSSRPCGFLLTYFSAQQIILITQGQKLI